MGTRPTRYLTDAEQREIDAITEDLDDLNTEQKRHVVAYLEGAIEDAEDNGEDDREVVAHLENLVMSDDEYRELGGEG